MEEGSVAERAGLRPGDSILEVNGTPFSGISHEEALKVMLQLCYRIEYIINFAVLMVDRHYYADSNVSVGKPCCC